MDTARAETVVVEKHERRVMVVLPIETFALLWGWMAAP